MTCSSRLRVGTTHVRFWGLRPGYKEVILRNKSIYLHILTDNARYKNFIVKNSKYRYYKFIIPFTLTTLFQFSMLQNNQLQYEKVSRYRPGVAQRVGRGIALLFHDRGTRRG